MCQSSIPSNDSFSAHTLLVRLRIAQLGKSLCDLSIRGRDGRRFLRVRLMRNGKLRFCGLNGQLIRTCIDLEQ